MPYDVKTVPLKRARPSSLAIQRPLSSSRTARMCFPRAPRDFLVHEALALGEREAPSVGSHPEAPVAALEEGGHLLAREAGFGGVAREALPSSRTSPPPEVPIQRRPARSTRRQSTKLWPSSGVVRVSNTVKRTPSKRTRPSRVPSQR